MPRSFILLTGAMFLFASCREQSDEEAVVSGPTFSAIERSQLLVIHHDREGNLIHYLVPERIADEMVIRVMPSLEEQDLFVTVLGANRHKLLKRSFSISTQIGKGFLGQIDVIVENGLAVSINGNEFHSPALVSNETLQMIDDELAKGKRSSDGDSTIRIMKDGVE